MPSFEQVNLQAFLNRLQSNTLTAADQAIIAQSLAFCILNWGQGGISVDPNVGSGTDPAPVDDTWFAILYNEALGLVTGGTLTPASWAQTAWFLDPQNVSGAASDANTGLTAAVPMKTWAAVLAKWGTAFPILRATVTVTFLSSHVDNTDPVICNPYLSNGASIIFQGATLASAPAVFTLNTAKSRAAGANALLSGSFSAGVPAPGVLVNNTTAGKTSRAWIYKAIGGGNFSLTQPMTLMGAIPGIYPDVEVNTWASTDTVTLQPLVSINIAMLQPVILDFNGAFTSGGWIANCTVLDPSGATNDNILVSSIVNFVECNVQRGLNSDGWQAIGGVGIKLLNVFNNGGVILPATTVLAFAGCITAAACLNASLWGNVPLVDADFIFGGTTLFPLGGVLGPVFLDGGLFVNSGGDLSLAANAGSGIACVVYGSAGNNINMRGAARCVNNTGNTFTTTFTAPALVTGIFLNGSGTGSSHSNANNPDVINANITTTPAHLDVAQGVAGFGGLAWNFGGAACLNNAN